MGCSGQDHEEIRQADSLACTIDCFRCSDQISLHGAEPGQSHKLYYLGRATEGHSATQRLSMPSLLHHFIQACPTKLRSCILHSVYVGYAESITGTLSAVSRTSGLGGHK